MSNFKKSNINIEVATNENDLPEQIKWSAEAGGVKDAAAEAMFLSLWDKKQGAAMRIDLWNREFNTDDMKQFMHQTLLTLADTFERATGEKNMSEDLRDYCHHFADKMGIAPPLS